MAWRQSFRSSRKASRIKRTMTWQRDEVCVDCQGLSLWERWHGVSRDGEGEDAFSLPLKPSPWGRWLDAKRQDGRGLVFLLHLSQLSQYTAFLPKVQAEEIRMESGHNTYLLHLSYILSLYGAHLYALCHQAGYKGHIFVQRCSCFRQGKTGILRLRKVTDAPQNRRCCVIGIS